MIENTIEIILLIIFAVGVSKKSTINFGVMNFYGPPAKSNTSKTKLRDRAARRRLKREKKSASEKRLKSC